MKNNFKYYIFYVCFRFDFNRKIINFFYYVKYAIFNDYTFFKHININVSNFLKNEHNEKII